MTMVKFAGYLQVLSVRRRNSKNDLVVRIKGHELGGPRVANLYF
jgi:hypothetical protein